jgi:nucleotide-binding universal stress UspA family protein
VVYAVEVANRYDAGVHVLHVIDEELAQGVTAGSVDSASVAADQQSFLADALDQVEESEPDDVPVSASSAAGFSASTLRRNPVTVVLETASDVGADFIVVPREERSALLGKVAEHVLSYASQPVLSV